MNPKTGYIVKEKHKTIIQCIDDFISLNGYSPTVREIAEQLRKPHGSIISQVKDLAVLGYLSYVPGKQRTLRVIKREEQ